MLDEVGVALARGFEHVGILVLVVVVEELDVSRGVRQLLNAAVEPERPSSLGEDVHPAVLGPLEHLRDPRGAADLAKPVVREPEDPELGVLLEARSDHQLVALLEDVQRHDLVRQEHEFKREQREALLEL